MFLNLTTPTLVIAGAFNPTIFTPEWNALHLFELPAGSEVAFIQAFHVNNPMAAYIYIDSVGLRTTRQHFEICINDTEENTLKLAEKVLANVFRKLPHTPFQAFGVNFQFGLAEASAEVVDKFKSRDGIDGLFPIKQERCVTAAELASDVILNLARLATFPEVQFDFNYHHSPINSQNADAKIAGSIQHYLDRSVQILHELYGLGEFQINRHDLGNQPAQQAEQ